MRYLLNIFLLISFLSFGQHDRVCLVPNRGQWDEAINYRINLVGGEMYVEDQGFTYKFDNRGELYGHHHDEKDHQAENSYRYHAIKTTFLGSNPTSNKIEEQPSDFYYNYFIDQDPSKWKANVHPFSKISYQNLYDGIDFVMEGALSSLKYSFVIQANVDPNQIQYQIKGSNKNYLDQEGNLHLKHNFGEIIESKPIAWNVDDKGNKKEVKVRFKLKNDVLSYEFPAGYNATEILVIDPNITFSSYTGSTSDNWGNTATPDPNANLFAAGIVFGSGYPTTAGAFDSSFNHTTNDNYNNFDVAVSKFNASGTSFLYSTYLGGSNGNEIPLSIVSDNLGNLFVLGTTSSSSFPTAGSPYQSGFNGGLMVTLNQILDFNAGTDIFISKINATGTSLLASTFLGGADNDGYNLGNQSADDGDLAQNYGDNFRGEIILDNNGNVIIASSTQSPDFPTVGAYQSSFGGNQDAVFAKLSSDLSSLSWSSYYGGAGVEAGYSVQVNAANELYASGGTLSSNLSFSSGNSTTNNGATDGYILRFAANTMSFLNGTYVGTSAYDQTYFVQLDDDGFVYVYGQTKGNMTITPGLYGTATAGQFVRKYSPNLNTIVWTTKIGGPSGNNHQLSPTAFLVSDCKEIYIAGWGGSILNTNISNFPVSSDAFMSSIPGGDGFYIAVLKPDAVALEYATFMGGPSDDHVDGGTSRFDKAGRIYHAVCSACGGNNNGFVSTPGVIGPSNNSNNCNLAAFKFELNSIEAVVTDPNYTICIPDPIQFFSNSVNGEVFVWDFGDGNTSNQMNPTHIYENEGVYTVKLTVYDSLFCKVPDSTSFQVEVGSFAPGFIDPVPTICQNIPQDISAGGGIYYSWFPTQYFSDPTISNPAVTLDATTELSVIIGDVCGSDTFNVVVNVFPDQISVSDDQSICIGGSVPIGVTGSVSQIWTPNTNINNNTLAQVIVNPVTDGYYVVDATTINNCQYSDSVYIDVQTDVPQPQLQDSAIMCNGATILLVASGGVNYLWYPNQYLNSNINDSVFTSTPIDITYYCDFSNSCGTLTDSVFIDVVTPNLQAFGDTILCYGDSTTLYATGVDEYFWYPSKFLDDSHNDTVLVYPQEATNYVVTGTDEFGCIDRDTVTVNIYAVNEVELGSFIRAEIGDVVPLFAETNDVEGAFNWFPSFNISCDTCQDPSVYPNFNTQYQVYFMDKNGCVTTDVIEIIYDGILYIPNTFTPDNNKFNQVFRMYGEGIDDIHLTIFNRWGEIICELNSMEEYWDGTYKGFQCQDGTYTWKLYYRDGNGNDIVKTGHVNLLR